MDITTLAAWGEFLGGIAVVVSLVYLASQIRQNSRLLRTSTGSTSTSVANDNLTLIVQDPEVAKMYMAGMSDRSSLAEVDQYRFDVLMMMQIGGLQQEYQFAADGVIGPALWEMRKRVMRGFLQLPGVKEWWADMRHNFSEDFCEFLDGLRREGEAAG
ncbi:MAG: hypothetical protein JRF61_16635 [Deltaproteobacteria bacterium]|jgi:hypothetical protein|nr:hypothetical protein [Deltaproteobacteria bacterium]